MAESETATTKADQDEGRRTVRISLIVMALLAPLGIAVFWWRDGIPGLLGFATGAGASAASFYFIHRFVDNLNLEPGAKAANPVTTVFSTLRLLMIAGVVYAILRSYPASIPATAAGLMLSVAGITLATLYEWFRASRH